MLNDHKETLNDHKETLNDQKETLNNQKETLNDHQEAKLQKCIAFTKDKRDNLSRNQELFSYNYKKICGKWDQGSVIMRNVKVV